MMVARAQPKSRYSIVSFTISVQSDQAASTVWSVTPMLLRPATKYSRARPLGVACRFHSAYITASFSFATIEIVNSQKDSELKARTGGLLRDEPDKGLLLGANEVVSATVEVIQRKLLGL